MNKTNTYTTILGGCWHEKVVSVFLLGHSKSHFRAPENAKNAHSKKWWPGDENAPKIIFDLLSYRYNIYQVRIEIWKLFDILVHPSTECNFDKIRRIKLNKTYFPEKILPCSCHTRKCSKTFDFWDISPEWRRNIVCPTKRQWRRQRQKR